MIRPSLPFMLCVALGYSYGCGDAGTNMQESPLSTAGASALGTAGDTSITAGSGVDAAGSGSAGDPAAIGGSGGSDEAGSSAAGTGAVAGSSAAGTGAGTGSAAGSGGGASGSGASGSGGSGGVPCAGATPHGCYVAQAGNHAMCPANTPEQSAYYPPMNEWDGCNGIMPEAPFGGDPKASCSYKGPAGKIATCLCDTGLHWLCTYP